jgi:hypothetical protein
MLLFVLLISTACALFLSCLPECLAILPSDVVACTAEHAELLQRPDLPFMAHDAADDPFVHVRCHEARPLRNTRKCHSYNTCLICRRADEGDCYGFTCSWH